MSSGRTAVRAVGHCSTEELRAYERSSRSTVWVELAGVSLGDLVALRLTDGTSNLDITASVALVDRGRTLLAFTGSDASFRADGPDDARGANSPEVPEPLCTTGGALSGPELTDPSRPVVNTGNLGGDPRDEKLFRRILWRRAYSANRPQDPMLLLDELTDQLDQSEIGEREPVDEDDWGEVPTELLDREEEE